MKRMRFVQAISLFLACVVVSVIAHSEDRKQIEAHLRSTYQGKVLTLRNFYEGKRLRYDHAGKLTKGGQVGPWTLYGKIKVQRLKLRKDKLEIEGNRLFLAYNKRKKKFTQLRGRKVRIEIKIQRRGQLSKEVVQRSIEQVFLSRDDKLVDLVPSYWRRFLAGKEEGQSSSQKNVYRVRGGVSAPQLIYRVKPEYTEGAKKARGEGTVVLYCVVDVRGRVRNILVIQPVGFGLDDKAVEAVRQWKFKPGMKNGLPVNVAATIEVTFVLLHREAKEILDVGNTSVKEGRYDEAIASHRKAVELEPDNADYHSALAFDLLANGEYDEARTEYTEALRLEPDYARLGLEPSHRGPALAFTYFVERRFKEAMGKLDRYFELTDTPSVFALIWKNLSLHHLGKRDEAQKLLGLHAKRFQSETWGAHLVRYHHGTVTESELLSRASSEKERCEAYFYIGYQYLLKGDERKAREYFQKTTETKVFDCIEHIGARARLEQLGAN